MGFFQDAWEGIKKHGRYAISPLGAWGEDEYMKPTQQEKASAEMMKIVQQLMGQAQGEGRTPPLDLDQLTELLNKYFAGASDQLGAAQERGLGTAARTGGAYAASKGLNPYAFIQQSQAPVYDRYTGEFGDLATSRLGEQAKLPYQVFQSKLSSNQEYWNRLIGLLSARSGATQGLQNKSPFDYWMKAGEMGAKIYGAGS